MAEMPDGYKLRQPCKNCPFAPTDTRIVFACKERAEEIEETAYRNGFPCHLSAEDTSEDEDGNENPEGGFEFGEKTQHCAGAIMMNIKSGYGSPWPGIGNDEDLLEKLEANMDWKAPHYESEEDFVKYGVQVRNTKDGRRPIPGTVWKKEKAK